MSDQLERLTAALADRYAIERELGAGGMAIVYLAEDLKHGRKVAVKVLRPEFASALGSDRFLREIAITAQLSHPHILPLLDSGHADGFLFYVMPYVDGESLRDRLNRKKQLPVDETLRFTTEIADALGSAHRHGVIHRDVKPENILLEEGHAVVADFGIARAMSAAGGDRLTETGLSVGTPAYMSPEQMSGESHVDERSDIYGLGCVVYEMLAGEHPFTGATMQAVLARKATGEVPRLRTVRAGVPASVENAIMKSLASVPSERFASAPEFAAALATKHPSTASRNRKFTVLVIAGVLAIVILGFFGVLPGTIRPAAAAFFAESDRVVVAEFENDTDQPALGLAIREAVTTDLEQSEYVNVVERPEINDVLQRMRLPDTTRFDLEVAREVARRQGYPAVVVGGISPVGAGFQLSVQIVEVSSGEVAVRIRETAANDTEVLKAVERLTHLTRRHLGESLASVRRSQPLPTVTTSSLEALQSFARGADYAARGNFGAAVANGVQAVQEDTAFAAAHRALSIWYQNIGDPVKAQAHIDLAHRYNDRLHPRERYLVGATYNSFRGQLDSTEYYYRLTIDRYLNDVTALNNLGDLRERMGRYEDALTLYQRAAEFGGSAVEHLNVASAARTLGRHQLADSVFTVMRERFPNIWLTWNTQISNALYAGDYVLTERIAKDMASHETPFPPVYGTHMLSSLSAMHGQVGQALALADSSSRMAVGVAGGWVYTPLLAAQYAALAAGTPEIMIPYLDAAPEIEALGTAPRFEYLMMGFVANGYALAGEREEAERILARMDSLALAVGIRPRGIGAQVRAVLALNANKPEESLEYIREAQATEYGLLHNTSRFLLAKTYEALGRWEDAAVHYDSLTSTYRLNVSDQRVFLPILPMAHERAAYAYLTLGDTAAAVTHLAAFVDLWENAEPSLQPTVATARTQLAELLGEPRRPQ